MIINYVECNKTINRDELSFQKRPYQQLNVISYGVEFGNYGETYTLIIIKVP